MIKIVRVVRDPSGARWGFIDCIVEKNNYFHNDIVLFEKNNKRWIKMPDSNKKTGQKNEKGYDILRPAGGYVDQKVQQQLSDAVIAALDKWLSEGNKPEIAPPKEQRQQQASPAYGAGSNGAYQESEGVPF